MTCFLRDRNEYTALFHILESFENQSGLQVNHGKTEILALGNHTVQHVDFAKHNVCEIIKILGVHFGYDLKQRDTLNYRQTLKDIKKSICGNGGACPCSEGFKLLKPLLSLNLCTEHL